MSLLIFFALIVIFLCILGGLAALAGFVATIVEEMYPISLEQKTRQKK